MYGVGSWFFFFFFYVFFFNDTATTEIYTLSLHDALPIYFAQQHKKGVVLDERNNGGGSAADYMIDVMSRTVFGYFNSKANDNRPWTTPIAGIWGPKVMLDRKSTRLNSSHWPISYAVFCLKKKKNKQTKRENKKKKKKK